MSLVIFVETGRGSVGMSPLADAQSLGYSTLLLSRDTSFYTATDADQERFDAHVDRFISCDTTSPEAVVAAVRDVMADTTVAGVTTPLEFYVPTVAAATRELGLAGLDPRAARTARDKRLTRAVCREAGVPAPLAEEAHTADELERAIDRIGLPVVVKPPTEVAGIGVRLCSTRPEARSHFDTLADATTDLRGLTRPPGVLVEEYVQGYEVSVESVDTSEGRVLIGMTDEITVGAPTFVEESLTFPSVLPGDVRAACVAVANRALDAIGFDFGASHVELKVTADGPKLIEINPRMAGAGIADLIKLATGVQLQRELIRLVAGAAPDFTPTHERGAAAQHLLAPHAGTFERFDGVELAAQHCGFADFTPYTQTGTEYRDLSDDRAQLAIVIYEAPTSVEAQRRARAGAADITPVMSERVEESVRG